MARDGLGRRGPAPRGGARRVPDRASRAAPPSSASCSSRASRSAGSQSGFTGPGMKAVIPDRATAKLEFRIVPDQDARGSPGPAPAAPRPARLRRRADRGAGDGRDRQDRSRRGHRRTPPSRPPGDSTVAPDPQADRGVRGPPGRLARAAARHPRRPDGHRPAGLPRPRHGRVRDRGALLAGIKYAAEILARFAGRPA